MANMTNKQENMVRTIVAGVLAWAMLGGCAQAAPKQVAMAPIADTEPDVTQQVSAVLGSIAQGSFEPGRLTDNARAATTAQQMQAMAAALRPCGTTPALELLQRTTKGEDRQYVYRAPCGGSAQIVEINFSKGARIHKLVVRAE